MQAFLTISIPTFSPFSLRLLPKAHEAHMGKLPLLLNVCLGLDFSLCSQKLCSFV